MRSKLSIPVLASTLAACNHVAQDLPERGVSAVHVPVVQRADYVFDAAAPGGGLLPSESARLNGWFQGLGLGAGDSVYVDGPYAESARSEVAMIAGQYGLLVRSGAPVTSSPVPEGSVRIVVSRYQASVPGCPDWTPQDVPNNNNLTMPNHGCGVNTNLAAMVANPQDLIHGQAGAAGGDARTAAKAITMYRDWPLTGLVDGQRKRPLKRNNTTGEEK